MAASKNALAEKLSALAERARGFQLESGTTSPTLDHLPEECKTVRQTISLVLIHGTARAPVFVLHREPMPRKTPEQPVIHRAAVFGGGMESAEEKQLRSLAAEQSFFLDPLLLNAEGEYPPDAWYRLQGKNFLHSGRLLQMTYHITPEAVQELIRSELTKRLRMEVGEATSLIGEPTVLHEAPVETAVLNRRLGPSTEGIAEKYGMSVNDRGELVGIGILVQERFTMAELLCNPRQFAERAHGNALTWSADQLVAIAERDTRDIEAWKHRLEHQNSNDELPIRNHSLLIGAAAAAKHLNEKSGFLNTMKDLWARLRGEHLAVAA